MRHLAKKTAWYSGSVFEPVYSDLLHGEDYRKVSLTFQTTTKSFYGRGIGGLGLALFPISKRILKIIDYETVRKFHKIITNSGYQSRYIQNIYRRDSTVVYPPIESALLSADELPMMEDRPFVLMVGAFVPYKNFQAGIRAMIPIKETHSLAMVGTGLLKEQDRGAGEQARDRPPHLLRLERLDNAQPLCEGELPDPSVALRRVRVHPRRGCAAS